MSYAKGKNFNVVFLPLRYSAGDTYRGSGLVFIYFKLLYTIVYSYINSNSQVLSIYTLFETSVVLSLLYVK